MQFLSLALSAFISLLISSSLGVIVSHDKDYDDASKSLNEVACSDGFNGLETRGYTTFGSIPNFPYIGGSSEVEGWNSTKCGACYNLTYTGADRQSRSVFITAVDRTGSGFNVAQPVFEKLVGSLKVGKAEINAHEVERSFCGFK